MNGLNPGELILNLPVDETVIREEDAEKLLLKNSSKGTLEDARESQVYNNRILKTDGTEEN